MEIKKGSTDRSVELYIVDATDGTPELGVLFNTSGIDLNYRRDGAAVVSVTEVTLAALTTAHADGGFKEIANGRYRFDLPDAAFATGVPKVTIGGTVTGMVVLPVNVNLVDYDPQDGVRLGLTALPAAAADAAGGLAISDAGGLALDDIPLTAEFEARTVSATAAGNMEDMYDGTGYIDPNGPSSRSQVDGIASSSGVGFPSEMTADNTTTDTIDNASAVDKGGGLVGIPVTGHAFATGREVTIAGTTNYNGAHAIVSQTTNEVVITDTFVSEAFAGTETIVSSIKGVVFVGTEDANTLMSTEAADGVYHQIGDTGNAIDLIYESNVTGSRIAVEFEFELYLNSNNDTINIQLFDFVGTDWETVFVLSGQNGASNVVDTFTVLQKHTGTGSDLGVVLVRFVTSGQTSPSLFVDKLLVMSSNLGQSVGYDNSSTWINSASPNAGTVPFEDAVGDKPTSTLDLARNIADAVGLVRFTFLPGSSTTLTQDFISKEFLGVRWTLAGAGFDLTNSRIKGASSVTGIFTGTGQFSFVECGIGTVTMHPSNGLLCGFSGVFTMGSAGFYTYGECAGFNITGNPEFDFGGFGASTLSLHGWSDGIQVSNMASGDKLVITGEGQLVINASCSDATLVIAGNISLDNQGTNMTIEQVARVDRPAINAEVDTALTDYAGPTKTEMDTAHGLLATEVKQDIIDTNVDQIEAAVITNAAGVDIAADIIAVKAETVLIVADTNELQTDNVPGLIAALNDVAATEIVSAGAITTLSGAVVNVDLVDVTTTNTDMVGTDNAALASVCTPTRLAELDAANLPATTDATLVDTGTTIPGLIAALNNLSAANVNAEVLDVLTVDTFAELTGVPAASVTFKDMLQWSYMIMRNKGTQTSTTQTVSNDAGTTIASATVSDDGTTFTKGEHV